MHAIVVSRSISGLNNISAALDGRRRCAMAIIELRVEAGGEEACLAGSSFSRYIAFHSSALSTTAINMTPV